MKPNTRNNKKDQVNQVSRTLDEDRRLDDEDMRDKAKFQQKTNDGIQKMKEEKKSKINSKINSDQVKKSES
jgi:hypothetical protein